MNSPVRVKSMKMTEADNTRHELVINAFSSNDSLTPAAMGVE